MLPMAFRPKESGRDRSRETDYQCHLVSPKLLPGCYCDGACVALTVALMSLASGCDDGEDNEDTWLRNESSDSWFGVADSLNDEAGLTSLGLTLDEFGDMTGIEQDARCRVSRPDPCFPDPDPCFPQRRDITKMLTAHQIAQTRPDQRPRAKKVFGIQQRLPARERLGAVDRAALDAPQVAEPVLLNRPTPVLDHPTPQCRHAGHRRFHATRLHGKG